MYNDSKINYQAKTKTILLTITELCNLNCIYCYEDFKSNNKMTFETAISIINSELSKLPDGITLDVSYFGGEPFLNFELIKKVYDYYDNKNINNIKYTCSTNGTLVHGEIKKWIEQHFPKFSYNLSFDGIEEVQNHNRSNSFSLIDLDFYSKLYGNNGFVKMTLHPDTISKLYESIIYIHSKNLHPIANCAYGINWNNDEILNIYKNQLLLLIEFYLENPNIPTCSLLDENIKILAYNTNFKPWCGIDKMTVFNTLGSSFPCHFFEDVTLGKELSTKLFDFDTKNLISYMDPCCKECPLITLCPTCFGSNYKANGCFCKRDINVCKTYKLQLYATAILNLKKIEKYGISNIGLNTVQQRELYEGICKINRFIDPDNL